PRATFAGRHFRTHHQARPRGRNTLMRAYLTLVRRELGGFFVSLTGYAVIAAVLLLLGLSFTGMLSALNDDPHGLMAPLTEVFYSTYYFWWILVFIAPVITIGSFASALTRSQIIAAMNSFVIGLGLFILSLRSLVPAPSADWAAKVFSYISLSEHMEDFAGGFVDTRHIVFYLSLTFFFLFLTLKVVESRRWK